MRYFKHIDTEETAFLYVVDDNHSTISQVAWDKQDKVTYNWDFGYNNLSTIEEYDEIDNGQYNESVDDITDSMRVGSRPPHRPST